MTPAELRARVNRGEDSKFFSYSSMKMFGDTMKNYGVRAQPVIFLNYLGETVIAYELYRRHRTKKGLTDSAYFDTTTFKRVFPDLERGLPSTTPFKRTDEYENNSHT